MTEDQTAMLARIDRMKRLVVTLVAGDYGGCLVVDAEAIMTSENDQRLWVLMPEENGEWTHGPSGMTAPLGAALWAIACCYDPEDPT